MKKIIVLLCSVVLCVLVPVTAFAADVSQIGSIDSLQQIGISPRSARITSSISKASSSSVKIAATALGASSKSVTAVCQLQRYVNGSWTNYGTAVSATGRGSARASKTIGITKGYSYRAKATSSDGTTAYSSTVKM